MDAQASAIQDMGPSLQEYDDIGRVYHVDTLSEEKRIESREGLVETPVDASENNDILSCMLLGGHTELDSLSKVGRTIVFD